MSMLTKTESVAAIDTNALRAVAADPELTAARDRVLTVARRLLELRERYTALVAELNSAPTERRRATLRVELERQDVQLGIQEAEREIEIAKADCRAVAQRVWAERIEPIASRQLEAAVEAFNQALIKAAELNAQLRVLETVTREVTPAELRHPHRTFGWQELALNSSGSSRLESWRHYVLQEIGLEL